MVVKMWIRYPVYYSVYTLVILLMADRYASFKLARLREARVGRGAGLDLRIAHEWVKLSDVGLSGVGVGWELDSPLGDSNLYPTTPGNKNGYAFLLPSLPAAGRPSLPGGEFAPVFYKIIA